MAASSATNKAVCDSGHCVPPETCARKKDATKIVGGKPGNHEARDKNRTSHTGSLPPGASACSLGYYE